MAPAHKGRQQRGKHPRLRPKPGATRSLMRGRATASAPILSEEPLSPQPSPVVRRVPEGPQNPHGEVPTTTVQRVRAWCPSRPGIHPHASLWAHSHSSSASSRRS